MSREGFYWIRWNRLCGWEPAMLDRHGAWHTIGVVRVCNEKDFWRIGPRIPTRRSNSPSRYKGWEKRNP